MDFEIIKEDWALFFESLSKRRYEWTTKVEVLNREMGDQILTDGLPFNGITVEMRGDRVSIDLSVGEDSNAHQTHNIEDPVKVTFLAAEGDRGEVIDIEEADGTKTLITFIAPMGILVGYERAEMVAMAR